MISLRPLFQVERREEDDVHYYAVEGQETYYPGATTILSAYPKQLYLTPWAAKMCAEYLRPYLRGQLKFDNLDDLIKVAKSQHRVEKEAAGKLGTAVHELLNKIIVGKEKMVEKDLPEEIQIPFNGFAKWVIERKPNFILPDTAVVNIELGYGGSFDTVLEENGTLILVDFKSSKRISDDYALQIASYIKAFRKVYGYDKEIKGRCVRFNKTGKPGYEEKDVKDVEKSFEGFQACLNLYKNLKIKHWEEN